MDSMDFANKIAEVSEKEAHHPNLTITWGICVVEIWTHKIMPKCTYANKCRVTFGTTVQ